MSAEDELFCSFEKGEQDKLSELFREYALTASQRHEVMKNHADLLSFCQGTVFDLLEMDKIDKKQGKRRAEELMRQIREKMHDIRYSETDYSDFSPEKIIRHRTEEDVIAGDDIRLMGKCPCPVDGEKTRCCKLTTLDAYAGCAFGCSYCSVQSFYTKGKISVVSNLSDKLKKIDTSGIWHIGTGQASDSLLLGNTHGTLSALAEFAEEHDDIIIELKSKSGRRDIFDRRYPRNMIFTYSLNSPLMIEKEEHLTGSLEERISAAEKAAEGGSLVGFHIHPMIYYKDWQDGYKEVVEKIVSSFTPDKICMISLGTLTFTKAVLHRLRKDRVQSRVFSMPLIESAGKYTYTLDIKREMFSYVYSLFPKEYKDNIFFYLCMEDPSLWMSVLGREYSCDKEFEDDMKKAYFGKVRNV